MATATYKFVGVPKTFTSKAAALRFLLNSPGYVQRREQYLATYWPGLLADVKGRTAPKGRAGITVAAEQAKLRRRSARLRGEAPAGGIIPAVVGGAVKAAGDKLQSGTDFVGEQTTKLLRPGSVTQSGVAHGHGQTFTPKDYARAWESVGDATLGKSVTNLVMHGDVPRNLGEAAGLGAGVLGILPVGRGVKGAGELAKAFKAGTDAEKAGVALGPKTLNETVQEAFSGVDEAIAAKNAINSQERAIRATGAVKAYHDAGGGTDGMRAAMGELRGAFPTVEYNGVSQELTPELVDHMVRVASDKIGPGFGFYDAVHVWQGLERAVSGKNVQKHQLDAIRNVFGVSTADALTQNRTFWQRLYNAGVHIWNIPRAIMASFDLSAPFRQALVAGTRHPIIFTKNFKPMIRAFGSERVSKAIAEEIPTRANFQRYGKAELKFSDMAGMREEQWPGSYVDNVPGVKHSARAYSAFLNKMRADVFDHLIGVAESHGKNIDDPTFLKALGEHVMNSTGRGRIPGGEAGEAAASFLNNFLFSPRLLASRFQILNPVYYGRLAAKDRWVAKQAAYSAATTLGGISAMVYLASQIPGAKVGLDPTSADFGKVRIGNTRIDFAGGFQPLIVLYSRWLKNEYTSSSTGKKVKLGSAFGVPNPGDLLIRFMESKMAPSPRLIWDLGNRENFVGEPMTWKNVGLGMLPLNFQGGLEAYQQEGSLPFGIGAGLLSSVGFGVNSYADKAPTSSSSSRRSNKPGGSRASNKPSRSRSSNKP